VNTSYIGFLGFFLFSRARVFFAFWVRNPEGRLAGRARDDAAPPRAIAAPARHLARGVSFVRRLGRATTPGLGVCVVASEQSVARDHVLEAREVRERAGRDGREAQRRVLGGVLGSGAGPGRDLALF